jgi:hypothetical protein
MTNRRRITPRAPDRERFDQRGRWKAGDIVSVQGETGRFRVKHFDFDAANRAQAHVWGGPKGREMQRTFFVDRLRTRHRSVEL